MVRKRWLARTGSPICEGYGLSEASPSVSCNPVLGGEFDGSIGMPLPGTDMMCVDEAGVEVLLVGDSAGNNVYGFETTVPVTVDHLVPQTAELDDQRRPARFGVDEDVAPIEAHDGPSAGEVHPQGNVVDVVVPPDKIELYLREIQASPALRATWAAMKARGLRVRQAGAYARTLAGSSGRK